LGQPIQFGEMVHDQKDHEMGNHWGHRELYQLQNCEGLACETPLSYWLNLGFWMILGGVEIRLMVVAVPYIVLFSSGCSMLL